MDYHPSEKGGLCSTFCPKEMLQILLCLIKKTTCHRGQLVDSQRGEESGGIGLGLWPVAVIYSAQIYLL